MVSPVICVSSASETPVVRTSVKKARTYMTVTMEPLGNPLYFTIDLKDLVLMNLHDK